ncbi:MAG: sigma 54-interacting transcriptional regulator [Deltaproteobacteria bacterium]|nr:sigma 54-interacting transcriptional regulator [Deltaproteobacteria bacterium]
MPSATDRSDETTQTLAGLGAPPPTPSLAVVATPAPATRDLAELARAATDAPLEELLRRGLEGLSRLAPYELAVVFSLDADGRTLRPRASKGPLASDVVKQHALSLDDFPSLREALETRRARAYTEDDHAHGDGDPFDGVLDLPHGHACMVAPLAAGDDVLGVLTLDRRECVSYPTSVVDLVEVYARILALAIKSHQQARELATLGRDALEHARALEEQMNGREDSSLGVSRSPLMRQLARRVEQVASASTPILILGETGTGKERLAQAIHRASARRDKAFVAVNCAAIPRDLLESELFGHVRGAFSGASRDRLGRFKSAHGGTLLLDEIGELPLDLQAKLLRVLQMGEVQAVGSDRPQKLDVRVLAATHVDLKRAVAEGRFREDLYYRLEVFPLTLPPLRERLEDLPSLCVALLAELGPRTGKKGFVVTDAGLEALARRSWPGNVRELANVLERAMLVATTTRLGPRELGLDARAEGPVLTPDSPTDTVPVTLAENERRHVAHVLARTGGRVYGEGGAAEILGLPPTTLQSRMKKLGLTRRGG